MPTTVIGIIDDGIAFAHERFRKTAGGTTTTRVEYWWLQDGVYTGPGVPPIPFGSQLKATQINGLLTQCTHGGVINEDEVYALAGLINFRREGHKTAAWRMAHGTHVLDIAAGYDPQAAPNDRPIVAVQLPVGTTADTSGTFLDVFLASGIRYILRCAEIIDGPTAKVVINISYGLIAGPHDGSSAIEAFIDIVRAWWKSRGGQLEVVLPAGNNYQSRCHADVSFGSTTSDVSLSWRIQPDDQTVSMLEIWLPVRSGFFGPDRVHLTITPPGGTASPPLGEDPTGGLIWPAPGGFAHALAVYWPHAHWPDPWPIRRAAFHIRLAPTTHLSPTAILAPSGIWTIRLFNHLLSPSERVHAWVQRDDSLYGFPQRGRQSYFDHADYQRFDHAGREIDIDVGNVSVIRRENTINGISTGQFPVVPGGFLRTEHEVARYSSAGQIQPALAPPPPPPLIRTPDALAASDDSMVHRGILAAGSRSGGAVAMTGTSVAAPQVARWIADRIADPAALRHPGDRAQAQAQAAVDDLGFNPPKPVPERGGSGRMLLGPLRPLPRP